MQAITDPIAEKNLLELIKSGNLRAVELLYDQYGSLLFSIIQRIMKDEKRSEEIMVKTFKYAWNNFNEYDINQRISIWMINIARRLSLDSITDDEKLSMQNQFIHSMKESITKEGISVIQLAFFGGLSIVKIAEGLGCNEKDVRILLSCEMTKLKKEFAADER